MAPAHFRFTVEIFRWPFAKDLRGCVIGQFVATSTHCLDAISAGAKLLTNRSNVHVDGAVVDRRIPSERCVDDAFAADDAAGLRSQKMQDAELSRGERNRRAF